MRSRWGSAVVVTAPAARVPPVPSLMCESSGEHMSRSQQPICDACGQPVLMRSELPPLPPIKQRILETVKRRPGITAQQLRDWVWVDDPNGGPLTGTKNLHVHVAQLNALLRPLGICVRSQGGGYQIIRSVS